jgi:hypothetical protein
MERLKPQAGNTEAVTEVWSIAEFCARQGLVADEEARLLRLFGPFATKGELLYNAARRPRWR